MVEEGVEGIVAGGMLLKLEYKEGGEMNGKGELR